MNFYDPTSGFSESYMLPEIELLIKGLVCCKDANHDTFGPPDRLYIE